MPHGETRTRPYHRQTERTKEKVTTALPIRSHGNVAFVSCPGVLHGVDQAKIRSTSHLFDRDRLEKIFRVGGAGPAPEILDSALDSILDSTLGSTLNSALASTVASILASTLASSLDSNPDLTLDFCLEQGPLIIHA